MKREIFLIGHFALVWLDAVKKNAGNAKSGEQKAIQAKSKATASMAKKYPAKAEENKVITRTFGSS